MPILIVLMFFLASYTEFQLLSRVYAYLSNQFDALSAIFLILSSFAFAFYLGVQIIRKQSQKFIAAMTRGDAVSKKSTRGFLNFFAGLLFIVPGYGSDLLAILCLLPPTAFLLNLFLGSLLQKLISSSRFTFVSGFPGAKGFESQYESQRQNPKPDDDPTIIDVEVVDSSKRLT